MNLVMVLFSLAGAILVGFSQPFYVGQPSDPMKGMSIWLGLLSLIGYVPLFIAISRRNLKFSFLLSLLFIAVHHTIALYWIYIALNVFGAIPAIPASVITVLVAIILGLMGAAFFTIGRFLSQRFHISFLILAPMTLCAAEYFRNFYLFGGFPWGNVGYSLGRIDEFLQLASLIGVYGIVFFIALINSLLAFAYVNKSRQRFFYFGLAFLLVIGSFSYGSLRLKYGKEQWSKTLKVALLQGNIPQEMKSSAGLHSNEIIDIYLSLHREAKSRGARLIVWPESAYPRLIEENITRLKVIADLGLPSILGASVYGEDPGESSFHAHNSALIFDEDGLVTKRYDKSHLVPFGEYVPWPMNGIVDKIVPGMGAFLPGVLFEPQIVKVGPNEKLKLGVTVCYEGIFPEISRAYVRNGAELLVNLTNDAWYGVSSAPYQHLLMYKMRSAESGLPFIRATNSGVSAWIDAFGTLHQSLGLFERGLIVADIPLIKKSTLYAKLGDVIPIFSLLLIILGYIGSIIPIHTYVRERQYKNLVVVVVLFALAFFAHIYFQREEFLTDESARTKSLIIALFSLLLMLGLLSKSAQTRKVLKISSGIIIFCSGILTIFQSLYFLLGGLFGLLLYLLALRMKEKSSW
jgi:apolipoprotein N-acyltransferase